MSRSNSHGSEGDRFIAACEEKISEIRRLRDKAVGLGGADSPEQFLQLLGRADLLLDNGMNASALVESVHPDLQMRSAAEKCRQELAGLASELQLDRELYEVAVQTEVSAQALEDQDRRYMRHVLRDFRRAGVDQDVAQRKEIRALHEELVALGQEFNRNIRSITRHILLDNESDLDGLPDDYISKHRTEPDGKIRITTDYPDFVPFMVYAKSGACRRRLHHEYFNRAYPENIPVLEKILERRHTLAGKLGYASWAAYVTEDKMIRSEQGIAKFIDGIIELIAEQAEKDIQILLQRKRKDKPAATVVEEWERGYYTELVRVETLGFDSQEIRPFLEYDRVRQGVLAITQELFHLEYRRSGEPAWHQSVETYDVYENDQHVGRFHLDMHPREGKYKHAAMFPIVSGVRGVQLPEGALVCNFPNPAASSQPALLEHTEVVTFFHEFGHLMHHILGGAPRYQRFSGVATEWDFVEVPSQIMEEWAYSYDALKGFARHHETGETVPEEMVARLNRVQRFARSARVRQQMSYAALSLAYHNRNPVGLDTTDVLRQNVTEYSAHPYVEGTHMQASFGHLEGYSALYYTYMWSLVIARDLLGRFAEKGLFDKETASAYRKSILEPGGSQDAEDLIESFLGRKHDFTAYKNWLDKGNDENGDHS